MDASGAHPGRQGGAFVGNSGMAGPGHKVPRKGLVAVLSAAPASLAKVGASLHRQPPRPLRREAAPDRHGRDPTTDPLRWLAPLGRGCRLVALWLHIALVLSSPPPCSCVGHRIAVLLGGIILHVAGAVATGIATLAKWIPPRRADPPFPEHPLWELFIWRNQVGRCIRRDLAAAVRSRRRGHRPRSTGGCAHSGRRSVTGFGASYWLPEHDSSTYVTAPRSAPGALVQTICSTIGSCPSIPSPPSAGRNPRSELGRAAQPGSASTPPSVPSPSS